MSHNNRSPNPFNWEPAVFFFIWFIVFVLLVSWVIYQ